MSHPTQKPDHNAATLFWDNRITRSKSVEEKEVSEAKVTMGSFSDNHAVLLFTRSLCDYCLSINFTRQKRFAKTGDKCLFPQERFVDRYTSHVIFLMQFTFHN